ncbi:MAG TPA: hypothetical protein ENI27_05495 [bacterium]|nr:hypothetical protein [bacterium]
MAFEELKKDIPIIFVPDATYMSDEGLLFAGRATVVADKVTYYKIKKLLEERGGLTDGGEEYRIGSAEN